MSGNLKGIEMIYGEFDESSRVLTTYKDGMRLSTVRIDNAGAMHDKVCGVMTESVNGQERICVYLAFGQSNFRPSRVIAFDKFGNYKGSRSLKGMRFSSIH
jgi:hypothetical protein